MSRRVISLIGVVLVAAACSEDPLGTHEVAEIARAEQRWSERKPASYTYEVRVSCFCPPQLGVMTEVTVVGDAVVRARPLTNVSGADDELPVDAWPTVPKLFEILKTAREGGHIKDITASFDPQFGYPTTINITCKPDVLDCGVHYQAQNLKPLP